MSDCSAAGSKPLISTTTSRQRGAQRRKWTPPPDCGSAPIGKHRTGAAPGETRCSGTKDLGDVTSSCCSSVTPMPARASTPRPRARLRAPPLHPRLTDDGCRDPVVSFDLRRDPICCRGRPHYAADRCRGLNQASRVCVVVLEEPGGSVMMARNLIAMINCGAVVSQTCTRCGHVSSELTMLHRGRIR